MSAQNMLAQAFRALHVPSNPIVLTNIYEAVTARAIVGLPCMKALATASYAVAAAAGVADDDMTLETNLAAVRAIAPMAT